MIKLTIQVYDIENVMVLYPYIRIYRSDAESGGYTHLAYVELVPDQSVYTYYDVTGNSDHWYRSSYYRDDSMESALSDATKGSVPTLFIGATYPNEMDFDNSQLVVIRKIRRLIGDNKDLSRIYLDDCSAGSCNFICPDGKTLKLDQKGWPVYVSLCEISNQSCENKTTLLDPIVQGYKYITFSGSLCDNEVCNYAFVDVWYQTFKFSDREIYEAYNDAMIPPLVPLNSVTQDHLILQAAIDLLENMTSDDMISDGALIRDDQSVYDPSPGLRERDKTIKRLKKMLDDLLKESINNAIINLTGVLID